MKQFGKILKFEFKNYFTNKIFIGVTIFLIILISVIMFFPRIIELVDNGENTDQKEELPVMLIVSEKEEYSDIIYEAFSSAFTDYDVENSNMDLEDVKEEIRSGSAECAFVMSELTSYTYYVNNLSMYDTNTAIADEALQSIYRMSSMVNSGLSAKEAQAILSTQINHETQTLGKDQAENYFYNVSSTKISKKKAEKGYCSDVKKVF